MPDHRPGPCKGTDRSTACKMREQRSGPSKISEQGSGESKWHGHRSGPYKLLGHKTDRMTRRYSGNVRKQRAAQLMPVYSPI